MTLTQIEAFAITLAIEAAVAAILAPRFSAPRGRAALAAAAASAVTHPLLWKGVYLIHPALGGWTVPLLEIAVVIAESAAYRLVPVPWRAALMLSLAANAASYLFGEFLYALA